jgi:hypothetical protein
MKTVIMPDVAKATYEQLKKTLDDVKFERPLYEKAMEHNKRLITLNERRKVLMKQLSDISDNNCEKLVPEYKFQAMPEWVEIQKELLKLESANKQLEMQEEIDKLKDAVKKIQDEFDRFDEAEKKLGDEIAKRGA